MELVTFEDAKLERDRILSSPRLDILNGLTISGKGKFEDMPSTGRTVLALDNHFVFQIVLDFTDGGHQTLHTTEDVDFFLSSGKL